MNASEIKDLRKMLKLSQDEFGTAIGVSRGTVVNYEKGQVIPRNKLILLMKMRDELQTKTGTSDIYLTKNGVRFELVELVDHFVKNADAYFDESEYLQLWHRKKVEDLLGDRLRSLGILGKEEN